MNIDGLNEDELNLLTDEERAGLENDDQDDGDEGGEGANDGDDDDAGDDDDDAGDAGTGGKEADEAAAAAAAPNKADGTAAADDDDDDDDTSPAPVPAAERVDEEKSKERLTAIDAEKDELEAKLDDGEITTKEFRAAIDKLNAEGNTLTNAIERQTSADQAVADNWYKDVNRFLTKNPELNLNQTRLHSFDAVVRRVTSDPENSGMSNRKQLEKARDIWREEMGIEAPAAKKADEPAPKPKAKAKDKAREVPPTLHNVPAADVNDADDGKYGYLDALLNAGKSIEYEDALARLSEADQQEYLSRA